MASLSAASAVGQSAAGLLPRQQAPGLARRGGDTCVNRPMLQPAARLPHAPFTGVGRAKQTLATQAAAADHHPPTAGDDRTDEAATSSSAAGNSSQGPELTPLVGAVVFKSGSALDERISSGEFTDVGSTKERVTRPLRKMLAKDPLGLGRAVALALANIGRQWRSAAALRMPEARGDIREIVGEPVFVPLYKLFKMYGPIFRLSFGPKSFVVVSDAAMTKQILLTNANKYSKGLLSEILDFVMGQGLIPADGEVWVTRRRAIVPSLHKKYVASMVDMFGECSLHGTRTLNKAAAAGQPVEMENFFSRLALDIIGKAVFGYEFDSLTHDDPVIQAVYTTLREAEYRSTFPIPYWNLAPLRAIVPRQRKCTEALRITNDTLDELIERCRRMVEEEDEQFGEDFLSEADPSILHFLVASGEQISSKQLRDDLMTLLIAGHETTAAVLTWTVYCLCKRPGYQQRLQAEVDAVLGDRKPTVADMRALVLTTRVINESMRLYPQPPVLIRRAIEDDVVGGYPVTKGSDIFISVWNLHRSSSYWSHPEEFDPDRWALDGPTPNEVTEDFAYLPFGGGKRKCIGDQFALFESIVALSMLVRRYEFSMADDAPPVGMETGATIHTTNGLYVTLTPRVVSGGSEAAASPVQLVMGGSDKGDGALGNGNGSGMEPASVASPT